MRQLILQGVTICVFWATDYASSRKIRHDFKRDIDGFLCSPKKAGL